MSSLGTSKGIIEIAKFAVYVSVPIALTYAVATDSKTLHRLMGFNYSCKRSHVLKEKRTLCWRIRTKAKKRSNDSGTIRTTNREHQNQIRENQCQNQRKRGGRTRKKKRRPYVVYPPEGPLPPSPEELRERAREMARRNNAR